MTTLMFALLVAFAVMTVMVLADSGLRLWQAFTGLKAAAVPIDNVVGLQAVARPRLEPRITTRVSFARSAPAPLRAAA